MGGMRRKPETGLDLSAPDYMFNVTRAEYSAERMKADWDRYIGSVRAGIHYALEHPEMIPDHIRNREDYPFTEEGFIALHRAYVNLAHENSVDPFERFYSPFGIVELDNLRELYLDFDQVIRHALRDL